MVDHERQLIRLAKKHLTRCPYCAKDYSEIPHPKLKQFRCLGCSAFISNEMMVEDLDDDTLRAIAASAVPEEFASLDELVKDWKP